MCRRHGGAAHAGLADSPVDHGLVHAVVDQVLECLLGPKAHSFLLRAQLGQQAVQGLGQALGADGGIQLVQPAVK